MAKEKKEKRCKECEGLGKECKCPKESKKGFYGLERRHGDDNDDHEAPIAQDEGGMAESIKMPRAPQDTDRDMQGISGERKKKKLADFRSATDDAKKRQGDQDRKAELANTRRTKGIRFYDSKGSGYMQGGKKTYD